MAENDVRTANFGADPAPLAFAALALATFALGVSLSGLASDRTWLGPALLAAGFALFVAGMWEFRNRVTVWATAFSAYGVFWLALGAYFVLVNVFHVSGGASSLGFLLLAFAIFNSYLLVWTTRVNVVVFGLFLALELTEILLFLGLFSNSDALVRVGGWGSILTALIAWYASAAGLLNTVGSRPMLWTGTPIWTQEAPAEREHTRARR